MTRILARILTRILQRDYAVFCDISDKIMVYYFYKITFDVGTFYKRSYVYISRIKDCSVQIYNSSYRSHRTRVSMREPAGYRNHIGGKCPRKARPRLGKKNPAREKTLD